MNAQFLILCTHFIKGSHNNTSQNIFVKCNRIFVLRYLYPIIQKFQILLLHHPFGCFHFILERKKCFHSICYKQYMFKSLFIFFKYYSSSNKMFHLFFFTSLSKNPFSDRSVTVFSSFVFISIYFLHFSQTFSE